MGDISHSQSERLERKELQDGWSFKQTDGSENTWYPVQRVPSVVHMDLMNNNL